MKLFTCFTREAREASITLAFISIHQVSAGSAIFTRRALAFVDI